MDKRYNQKVDFELSNIDGGGTKGGTKVQPCVATSHGLTAYKCAPCKKFFKIEILQYWKAYSRTILSLCWSVVHHFLLL